MKTAIEKKLPNVLSSTVTTQPWDPTPHITGSMGLSAPPVGSSKPGDTAVRIPPPRVGRKMAIQVRIGFWVVGVLLILLGIVGALLPVLQGWIFFVLAAAVLSLASDSLYCWLRGHLAHRIPASWNRLERFRTRLRWMFREPPEPKGAAPHPGPAARVDDTVA